LSPIPSTEGVTAPKAGRPADSLRSAAAAAQYSVVSVRHQRPAAKGGAELEGVELVGNPPATEPFRSVVRVKCSQRAGTAIEVVILDPRGDTVMTASGQLHYKTGKADSDESDYTVDWESTPWPTGGTFSVLVRVAGQPMGTWPLKILGPRKGA
ncbi:MAG TPA: hypothetical protein VEY30_14255, partial [Myxococcaceae bacterium]|nr:hypothetical protein [Myxococcaceae bacterium]